MDKGLEQLLLKAKDLLSNDKLANEIRRIRDAYEILVEPDMNFTFEHTFSRSSFKSFEKVVSESIEDKTEGFRQYVHKLLGEKELTKAIISNRSGIEETTLNRYLNGNRTPPIDMVFRIALALRLNLVETETLLRKMNRGFKNSPKDGVIIEALKQRNYDYLAVEAVLKLLTNGEESILTLKEKSSFNDEDWDIEITD